MNVELLETLGAFRANPARVVDLYRQLYEGSFLVLVQAGSQASLSTMNFLTYPTSDGSQQLPVFTRSEYVLEERLPDAIPVTLEGKVLWSRLLEFIGPETCTVEVDPGQPHGIRLRRDMILGMVAKYGSVTR